MLDTADALTSLADSLPPEVAEPLGLTNFGTAAGYLNGELFAMLLPFIAGIMGLTRVSNQLADAENAGRVEILYTLPVPRCEIALARWAACVGLFLLGLCHRRDRLPCLRRDGRAGPGHGRAAGGARGGLHCVRGAADGGRAVRLPALLPPGIGRSVRAH